MQIIGRKEEAAQLLQAYTSNRPEMVAVLGRRRVGKTFLIRNCFEKKIDFEMVGLKKGTNQQQLRNFAYSLKDAKGSEQLGKVPSDWLEAFNQLKEHLNGLGDAGDHKHIVFIDEVPWIATKRSDFLTGLSYFWNSYASKANILVVICGSATAWMVNQILNDRGGLHNRVTRRIHLNPFTLGETKAYFEARNIHFEPYELLTIYMTLGGIPHYLDQIEGGKTATQNIDNVCFSPQGALRHEFENLYTALFSSPEKYEAVVIALANAWKGMSRSDIVKASKLQDGGGLTTVLKELEMSGFITSYTPWGKKKKDTLYRLTDCYSLFYLKFIAPLADNEAGQWHLVNQTAVWKAWSGYAFENVCLLHVHKIKQALGISGILTRQQSYWEKGNDEQEGVQIDLLIDRNDNSVTICEMKFFNDEFSLHRETAAQLRRKISAFRKNTGSKKQVFLTLVTTYGLLPNTFSLGLVDHVVTMEDLIA